MKIETLAVHAAREADPATGAIAPPIHLSTTFEREADGTYPRGWYYTRPGNPTRDALERCLALLEGGAAGGAVGGAAGNAAAAAFASGSAATAAIFQTLAPGDHVIAPNDAYYGTARILQDIFARWGLATTYVSMDDASNVERALRPNTKLIWTETPSNPLLAVTDLAAVAAIARAAGALCACDNTWATPVLQRPLDLGFDLVLHSTTKYLGGHADVLGGAVVARDPGGTFESIRAIQTAAGAVPSPFDCWLVLRGIRTLPLRVRAQSESALSLARMLEAHPSIESVHYPGLPSHPGHAVAAAQMRSFGGMLSIRVRGDRERALQVAARTKLFFRATSLGSVESLIEHRASIEPPETGTPQNLLRLSVGLEHPDDLAEDLRRALE